MSATTVDTTELVRSLNNLARDYDLEAELATGQLKTTITESAALLRLVAVLVRDNVRGYDLTHGYVWLRAGRRLLLTIDTRSNA